MNPPIKGHSFTPLDLAVAARQDRRRLRCGTSKQLAKFVKNRLSEMLNVGEISHEELAKSIAEYEKLTDKSVVSNAVFHAIVTLYQETQACRVAG